MTLSRLKDKAELLVLDIAASTFGLVWVYALVLAKATLPPSLKKKLDPKGVYFRHSEHLAED